MSLTPDTLKSDTLTPKTISQLQTMIQADPALLTQLQACTDVASSATVIAAAAAAKGIDVSTSAVVAHFEAATAKQGAMSDAELEQVAGGGTGSAVFLSIVSFGVVCAGYTIAAAITKTNCGADLNAMLPW